MGFSRWATGTPSTTSSAVMRMANLRCLFTAVQVVEVTSVPDVSSIRRAIGSLCSINAELAEVVPKLH